MISKTKNFVLVSSTFKTTKKFEVLYFLRFLGERIFELKGLLKTFLCVFFFQK